MYFPDLLLPVLDERYVMYSLVKKYLCASVAGAVATCDPRRCEAGLADATTRAEVVTASRQLWRSYYGEEIGDETAISDAFTDLLDGLGL